LQQHHPPQLPPPALQSHSLGHEIAQLSLCSPAVSGTPGSPPHHSLAPLEEDPEGVAVDEAYLAAQRAAEEAAMADNVESYVCMNEVIVDRGSSAYLTMLECSVDGMLFTRVQADGIIIATPTGSTAYSLSAGGSMCHPEVPCMLFTPVCPHSLSFRPLLFPDTSTLQIAVSDESRGCNSASFDGRHRASLNPGDSILVSMSRFPLPSICRLDPTTDWFDGVRGVLQWNSRSASQKSFHQGGGAGHGGSDKAASGGAHHQTAASVAAATAAATAKRAAFQTAQRAQQDGSKAAGGGAAQTPVLPKAAQSSSAVSAPASGSLVAPHPHPAPRLPGEQAGGLAAHGASAQDVPEQHSHSAPPPRDTPEAQW
jgi:NAD+ kinase